ncbi:nucleoid-associated protein [Pseudoteredinibacter isoporae]|uniref:Nucleoid-associated protein YejK n=1 Tax=Pseudoteredinibacter isoporae TaxID=570281 RepID=A0A7X0MXS1_9GAMM|nr:nucleoid-associated protein [Pseudoteredinibacter isoporae]MBB6522289.1 nucleoid-associated protein YejK [Pseudoteredinibacter isoporae]NHO87822.1 nucleoid-associated protein [Pseudoteredinibacter isoporae]NIB23847.1 nucleoid-associated protein [Pseudoteredinibacter isoporae]
MLECDDCKIAYEESLAECPNCEPEKTKIIQPLKVVSAVTAQFISEKGADDIDSKIGLPWPIENEICYAFITQVERKFKRKNKFHSYYEQQDSDTSMPSRLQKYIRGETDFLKLIDMLMDELVLSAIDSGAVKITGGGIVFMHYKDNDEDDVGRLLAVMVDNRSGFKFDGDLIPENAQHINLNTLKQAALFDLTGFKETYPEKPEGKTYLKFIAGSSASAFFKKAFGCEIKADNAKSVDQLYAALEKYRSTLNLPVEDYHKSRRRLDKELEKAARDKKPVSLDALSVLIDSEIPDAFKQGKSFSEFVNDNDFEVNDYIEPTVQAVEAEQWVNVNAPDESFSAKIYRAKIGGVGSGHPIEYDVDTHKLTLSVNDHNEQQSLKDLVDTDE